MPVRPPAGTAAPPHDDGAATDGAGTDGGAPDGAGTDGPATDGPATDDGAPAGARPADLLMLGGDAPGCVGDGCALPPTGGW